MYSHTTIGTSNFTVSRAFYDALMEILAVPTLITDGETSIGYGELTGPKLWIVPPQDSGVASPGNGTMMAFKAETREAVDAFHEAALANGGSDEGAPGVRAHYHPNFYGCYVRDPEGNKLCCVCHRKPD